MVATEAGFGRALVDGKTTEASTNLLKVLVSVEVGGEGLDDDRSPRVSGANIRLPLDPVWTEMLQGRAAQQFARNLSAGTVEARRGTVVRFREFARGLSVGVDGRDGR